MTPMDTVNLMTTVANLQRQCATYEQLFAHLTIQEKADYSLLGEIAMRLGCPQPWLEQCRRERIAYFEAACVAAGDAQSPEEADRLVAKSEMEIQMGDAFAPLFQQ